MAIATPGGLSPADFDADGDVDLADFSILSPMLNQATGESANAEVRMRSAECRTNGTQATDERASAEV